MSTHAAAWEHPVRRDAAARQIALEDLPVGRAEVELSSPPETLQIADGAVDATKVMTLVRLHTHPLGMVVLDGGTDLRWSTHAATVWAATREAANAHLVADGLPAADDWTELSCSPASFPKCMARRCTVLANAPRISVVVATRERPHLLGICLDALLGMAYPDYEIVVVDNAPETADTARLVNSRYDSSLRYVREDWKGLAAAHNRGLHEATGSIIAFVDDDVVVDEHWLTAIAEGFSAAGDVGCVTGLILPAELTTPAQLLLEQHGGFDKGFDLTVFDTGSNRPDDPLFPFTAGRLGSGANMAFDAAVLRGLGGFDTAIGTGTVARGGDDLAAFFRVVLDHRLIYQPAAVVWHRHHREMAALQNQAYGYGVGLGAYLASVLLREPRTWAALLRRLPSGMSYAFSSASARNQNRY
ncbi:MAG TPA: glycosyltransferase, partial [Mycobacterium sp.]